MKRERDLPLHRHFPDRRAPRGFQPALADAVGLRLGDDPRIVGVEEDRELGRVEILLVRDAGRLLDPVGVIEHDAEIAYAAHACLRAHGRLAGLDARIAQDALLGLPARPVVVDLLVGAARHAHAPASALVLVDQDNAVLLAFVDRAGGAGRDASRIEAVLAQPRQIHHEGVFELSVDFLLHALEVHVLRALGEFAAQDFLPVGAPLDLLHALAGDERARPRGRGGLQLRRVLQVLIVEGEGLVVVVDLGQVRVGENLRQHAPFRAHPRLDPAVALAHPAAVPALLVLPVLGISDAGLGLDFVEPGVFHALPVRPNVLASDGAGVAADALVEVEHHRNLGADFHSAASIFGATAAGPGWSAAGLSSQSTLAILRTMTNSSRFVPIVP